jgi:glyoxylase I family protein
MLRAAATGISQAPMLRLGMYLPVLYNVSPASPEPQERSATPMKLKLHHVNLCSTNVPALDAFYRDVLDMKTEPGLGDNRTPGGGYPGKVSFVTDGTTQFHLAEKDLGINFRTGQAINPVERGHIAFRTDDIDAFKARLKEKGIPYSDFGTWAMKGWEQIFFYDPDGNIVEVHQVRE